MRVSERRRANNNDEEEDDDSATAGCRCYSNVKEGPYKRATRPGSMRWYWDWGSWVVGWGGALEVPRSRRERYPAAVVAQHQSVGVGRSLSLPLKRKSLPLFLRALVVASLAVVPTHTPSLKTMATLGEKVARYGATTKQGVLERMGFTENTAEPKELREANKVSCSRSPSIEQRARVRARCDTHAKELALDRFSMSRR